MGRINWGRVLLGGILAGIVVNVSEMLLNTVVAGDQVAEAMRARNLDPDAASVAIWIVYGFLVGILAVWLYAAIRPRYGPGAKTALIAGFLVWALGYLLPSIAMLNIGMYTQNMIVMGAIWGLVEVLVATVLGAWVYREEATAYEGSYAREERLAARG